MTGAFLSDADAFTVLMEQDPLLRSTITAVITFDRTPDWEALRGRIDRATRLAPSFRRCLDPGRPPLIPPRWVDDPHFDLDWHLRRIAAPSPHTLDTVLDLAEIAAVTAFDPVRPRWDVTLVEGLDDGAAALVLRIHHSLTDGVGGIELAAHIVDFERNPAAQPPMPDVPAPLDRPALGAGGERAWSGVQQVGGLMAAAAHAAPKLMVAAARRPLSIWGDAASLVASISRMVEPATTTWSPVMTDRRLAWRFHAFETPLATLREVSHMAGGSLNAAFLAGIAGGMAHYHALHDSSVEQVRVTMPINLRHGDEGVAGNHISLVRVAVPVGDLDPMSRMLEIDHTSRTWREEPALAYSDAIAGALNLLPSSVTGGMLKHVDLVASNVPGLDVDAFVGGARVDGFYAFGPPIGAAANVTLMSYRDRCCIGLTTDLGAVPDHDVFEACMRVGFDEVLALAASPAATTHVGGRRA